MLLKLDFAEVWKVLAMLLAMAHPKGDFGHAGSHGHKAGGHGVNQPGNGHGTRPTKGAPPVAGPPKSDLPTNALSSVTAPGTTVPASALSSSSSSTSVQGPVSTYKPIAEQKCPDGSAWFELKDALTSVDEKSWSLGAANGALISFEDGMKMTLNQSAVSVVRPDRLFPRVPLSIPLSYPFSTSPV